MLSQAKIASGMQRYTFICTSCGGLTESFDSSGGICNVCEAFTSTTLAEAKKDLEAYELLSTLHSAISSKDWKNVAKVADQMAAKNDPYLLYGAGIAYLAYSDAEYSNINYALPGYMEENAEHKENSINIFSKATLYLEKVIWFSDNPNVGSEDQRMYLKFIASLKLRQFEDMQIYLTKINKSSKNKIISKYANMVYYSYAGDPKKSNQFAEELLNLGILMSLYYMARNKLKERKLKEAKKLLERLLSEVEVPAAKSLLEFVENALSV